ncbi:MAG: DUF2344 domain-containing protein [Lachnospiraceae bacterium]|nr:DUF2344 domain-containing protein [Lachnospiraceae bacterium]
MKLRIKFSKKGPLRFIGHLDIMRYFQKAIRRSDIDIAYSTGFSPHQIMSFAAPLGVGVESEGEYFDIEANSVTTADDMIKRLNAEMAEGMSITGMRILPDNAKNAMASVKAASYRLNWKEGYAPEYDLSAAVARFHDQKEVTYVKQTAKSTIERNLKEAVYELKAIDDRTIYMLVDASSAGNVKPGAVLECLAGFYNREHNPNAVQITREDTFTDGTDGTFLSLGEIGEKF